MRAVVRVTLFALLGGLPTAQLQAQGTWVPPQPPCELPAAPSKISNGMQALRNAVEKPEQRDQQLAQARKLLTDAIVQDNQGANAAVWYYLGRYYVETGDASGADSALTRAGTLAPKCGDDIATYRNELWGKLVNTGLSAWQDGKQDSGLALLRVAAHLEPKNPKTFSTIAGLYASRGSDDSASAYYALAADRKSTRLNSSHVEISYAVFCLKKKKKTIAHYASRDHGYPAGSAPAGGGDVGAW